MQNSMLSIVLRFYHLNFVRFLLCLFLFYIDDIGDSGEILETQVIEGIVSFFFSVIVKFSSLKTDNALQ